MNIKLNMLGGLPDILKEQAEKKRRYVEALKQLPSEGLFIPKNELKTIRSINKLLNNGIQKIKRQREMHEKNPNLFPPVPRGGEQEKNVLADMMDMLDKLDNIWLCKFSTESQGDGNNLVETPDDSVYYMTFSGASIRFKMANLDRGIEKVVQPFAECIYFTNSDRNISETPKLGYFTEEYFTREFEEIISSEKPPEDYQSSLKKYYQDGKLIAIPKADKVSFHHNGSPVNRIFFENNQ